MFIDKNCPFDPVHTFECGQCFRWNCGPDGIYVGVAEGRLCRVSGREIICEDKDFDFWSNYFSFDTDYNKICNTLISKDEGLKKCIEFGNGIRILKQDVWETIISFIISANNNIPRIKRIIESLCLNFGERLTSNNIVYYSFPSPQRMAALSKEDLAVLRVGYRDEYILDAATKVAKKEIDIAALHTMSDKEAKAELMKIKGVGGKVADCIMLFALGRFSVFPTDVWIKKILTEVYGVSDKDIPTFVSQKYGDYAGFAQQYLYYYYRSQSDLKNGE